MQSAKHQAAEQDLKGMVEKDGQQHEARIREAPPTVSGVDGSEQGNTHGKRLLRRTEEGGHAVGWRELEP